MDAARSLNSARVYISAVNGTLGTTDCTADIYSDNGGQPGSSLGSVSLGSAPSAPGWVTFSFGTSIALSADTQYWLVLKNANGTAGTNFPTYQWGTSNTGIQTTCGFPGVTGWQKCSSGNSGGSWASFQNVPCGYRLGFADGTYLGLPVQNISNSADLVYGTRESGVKFTSPANATLSVSGISFWIKRTGSTAGNLRYRVYFGATPVLQGTTNNVAAGQVNSASQYQVLHFASPLSIPAGTVVRVTMGVVSGGDSSDYYSDFSEYTLDSNASSLALSGFLGTLQKTYFDGTTWTDTAAAVHPFTLLLNTDGEFVSSGGGSSFSWIEG